MRTVIGLVVLAALSAGCARAAGSSGALVEGGAPSATSSTEATTTTAASTTTTAAPATSSTRPPATAAPTTAAPGTTAAVAVAAAPAPGPAATRKVFEQAYTPFATVGGVVLRHPASRVELIGYHESNLDGARDLEPLPTSAPHTILEGRARDTGARTAADIIVDPDAEIRAPVTGTVLYSGTYVLYCKYSDDFLVIEPDDHPGWEVKVLHIDGVRVRPGNRVTAAQTVIAPRATRLPFASQVEEGAATPPWPHVHVEVDDPTIPDRPTPGGGC